MNAIEGNLISKEPTRLILNVGGIHFNILITISTFESLPDSGSELKILTYLNVKEDSLDLFGFGSEEERSLFLNLLTITGIGPRSAMNILSGTNPEEFKKRIIAGDVKSLTIIPGIGMKTAKRIIVELKEKFADFSDEETGLEFLSEEDSSLAKDVIQALVSLGYKRNQINMVLKDLEKAGNLSGSLESTIKKALTKIR